MSYARNLSKIDFLNESLPNFRVLPRSPGTLGIFDREWFGGKRRG